MLWARDFHWFRLYQLATIEGKIVLRSAPNDSPSTTQVQAQLPELIHQLAPGDELVITENDQPVARIVPPVRATAVRKLGTLHGTVLYMAPDFNAPLEEFKEYMG
jgi:antitoxin (DNA-binding transcriptional repressor) of toxin-antitoxin stability system